MTGGLILSLFPGIDGLGRGFEAEGFCVVRGPDLLWGGDIHDFHPPTGRFDGVIGGPPCKGESALAHLNGTPGRTLRHEFLRVLYEARPAWCVMEAVRPHRDLFDGVQITALSPRWLGEKQSRRRYFHSNLNLAAHLEVVALEDPEYRYAVLAAHGGAEGTVWRRMATYEWAEMCALQGFPPDFALPGFTRQAAREAMGNAVPVTMARAIARAVRRALECAA